MGPALFSRAIALTLALSVPGCTLVIAGAGAGVAGTHNAIASDPDDDWSVGKAALIGAGIGLVADVIILFVAAKQWGKGFN